MYIRFSILILVGIWMSSLLLSSCRHDPFFDDVPPVDVDTTGDTTIIDTTTIDTTGVDTAMACDPDIIYFERDILPVLYSNCAFSGCHDAASAEDGVILTDYQNAITTADVEPLNLEDSKIYEVLVNSDLEERMPPLPASALPPAQIQVIAKWILQGAKNLKCDIDPSNCNTENISFSDFIKPLIDTYCRGCHSGDTPSGGIRLTNHAEITSVAASGRLYGAVARQAGFVGMPFGSDRLPQCDIDKLKSWIDAGSPDN